MPPAKEKKTAKKESILTEPQVEPKDVLSLKVHSFNNVTSLPVPFDIKIKLSFVEEVIGETPLFNVEVVDETVIDAEFTFKSIASGFKLYQQLLNNPFFFTVSASNFQTNSKQTSGKSTVSGGGSTKGKGKTAEITIGSTSFDILPLLLGRHDVKNILVLESEELLEGSETISWPNLPFLTITAYVIGDILTSDKARPFNIMYFTLESLYNLPESVTKLSVAITLPMNGKEENEIIRFENSQYKVVACPNEKKKWGTLPYITGRASLTDYLKSKTSFCNAAGVDDADLRNLTSLPRLEWNAIQRCWLLEAGQEIIINRLTKYRCWPVEIFINELEIPKSTKGKSKSGIEGMLLSKVHFIAYLDLTRLLYPGVKEVRVTSQLYTYVKNDLKNRSGQEVSFFDKPEAMSDESAVVKPESTKTAKKSKIVGKKSKANIDEDEEVSFPIFTEDGKPAFVTIQVEIMNPFFRKRTELELESRILELVPKRPPPDTALVNSEKAQKEFHDCIEELTAFLDKHFQEFCKHQGTNLSKGNIKKEFLMYIEELGVATKLINTLRDKVIDNVKLKIGVPNVVDYDLSYENYTSDVYSRIVEKMLYTINSITDGHLTSQRNHLDPKPIQVTTPELFFFALEASEEGYVQRAKTYLLKRLNFNKSNPQFWFDLASLMIRNSDFSNALEYVKEVIIVDTRHKYGLLMYGILLCMREEYEDAELVLDAVTTFYPRFIEGWIAFHLFYVHLQNHERADTTYMFAKKNEEFGSASWPGTIQEQSLLSWCPHVVTSTSSLYLDAAVILLRLNCYTFVEMSLAKEMETCQDGNEISVSLLYTMAACDYKRDQFEQAVSHLEAALRLCWKLPQLHCLMGHCYYKMQQSDKALESYNIAFGLEDPSSNLHLTCLRAGFLYIEKGLYEDAKKKFLHICKHNPTPLTWLGLGIACYRLKDFEDAECALSEANMLDNEMAFVWGYLAMTNIMLQRAYLFLDCYYQAIRCGLDDPKVIEEIEELKRTYLMKPHINN